MIVNRLLKYYFSLVLNFFIFLSPLPASTGHIGAAGLPSHANFSWYSMIRCTLLLYMTGQLINTGIGNFVRKPYRLHVGLGPSNRVHMYTEGVPKFTSKKYCYHDLYHLYLVSSSKPKDSMKEVSTQSERICFLRMFMYNNQWKHKPLMVLQDKVNLQCIIW